MASLSYGGSLGRESEGKNRERRERKWPKKGSWKGRDNKGEERKG